VAPNAATRATTSSRIEGVTSGPAPVSPVQLALRGSSLNLVAGALSALSAFATALVVSRGLGADRAGSLWLAVAVFTILTSVLPMGASSTIVRSVARSVEYGSQGAARTIRIALVPGLAAAAATALAVFLAARPLADIIAGSEAIDVERSLQVLSPFLPAAVAASVLVGATRGFGDMRQTALIDGVLKTSLRLGFLCVAVFFAASSGVVAFAWALAIVPCLWLNWRSVKRRLPSARTQIGQLPMSETPGGFWKLAGPQGVTDTLQASIQWIDLILVGAIASAAAAGVYSAVARLLLVGELPLVAVALAVAPRIAPMLQSESSLTLARDVFQRGTLWVVALSVPIYAGLWAVPVTWMGLFGADFRTGATALSIAAVGLCLNAAAGPTMMVLVMGGRTKALMLISMAGLAINLGLNVALIPRFGISGAAAAWCASGVLVNLGASTIAVRTWHIHPVTRDWILLTTCGCALFGLGLRLSSGRALSFDRVDICYLLVATSFYSLIIWRLRRTIIGGSHMSLAG
jgi:O-antigen/teichoic acid export membrane protein